MKKGFGGGPRSFRRILPPDSILRNPKVSNRRRILLDDGKAAYVSLAEVRFARLGRRASICRTAEDRSPRCREG